MLKAATSRNGDLKLYRTERLGPAHLSSGRLVEGENDEIQTADDSSGNRRVRTTWNEGDAKMTVTFSKGLRRAAIVRPESRGRAENLI